LLDLQADLGHNAQTIGASDFLDGRIVIVMEFNPGMPDGLPLYQTAEEVSRKRGLGTGDAFFPLGMGDSNHHEIGTADPENGAGRDPRIDCNSLAARG